MKLVLCGRVGELVRVNADGACTECGDATGHTPVTESREIDVGFFAERAKASLASFERAWERAWARRGGASRQTEEEWWREFDAYRRARSEGKT